MQKVFFPLSIFILRTKLNFRTNLSWPVLLSIHVFQACTEIYWSHRLALSFWKVDQIMNLTVGDSWKVITWLKEGRQWFSLISLGSCPTSHVPQLLSPEPMLRLQEQQLLTPTCLRARALKWEKLWQWETQALQLESAHSRWQRPSIANK